MRKIVLMLLFISSMSCAHEASGLITDGPSVQESTCDIANECCDRDGKVICCFDNGKRIICCENAPCKLGDR